MLKKAIYPAKFVLMAAFSLGMTACSPVAITQDFLAEEPQLEGYTTVSNILKKLPPPKQPIALAVYRFDDKTGQNKPSDDFPEYSRAVTQGGASILAKALYDAGNGKWFSVLEREGLTNLAQERKIIRATRGEYTRPDGSKLPDVGPLLYAGMLIEGGIIAYESDTITGGFGARYLGIGGDTQYRRDVVTVALRAISVKTGEVVLAVNTSKTIFLTSIDGNLLRFTSLDELLQIESGVTMNEPPQFAARQAIELAVYSMIMEGAEKGLWGFANASVGKRLVSNYINKRDGDSSVIEDVEDVLAAQPAPRRLAPPVGSIPPAPVSRAVAPPPPSRAVAPPPPPSIMRLPPPPVPPEASGRTVIQQLPSASRLTDPKKTPKYLKTREDFRRKVRAALKAKGVEDQDEDVPISNDGVGNNNIQGGQVIYCGPSGCVPTYNSTR